MKRSNNVRLTIMAAAIPVALAGCDPGPPTGEVLASVSDCDTVTDVSPEECRAQYQKALTEHERVAPRFESSRDCSDQFGSCTAVTNPQTGGTSYIPPMTGFLLGYVLSDALNSGRRNYSRSNDCSRYPDQQGCRSNAGGYRTISGSTPLYRDYRSGEYVKPNGDYAASKAGKVSGSHGDVTPPSRAITVSRSGFGSSSAARSSFGGGRGFGG